MLACNKSVNVEKTKLQLYNSMLKYIHHILHGILDDILKDIYKSIILIITVSFQLLSLLLWDVSPYNLVLYTVSMSE